MPQAVITFVGYVVSGAVAVLETFVGFEAAIAILDIGIKLAGMSFLNSIYDHFFGLEDVGTSPSTFMATIRNTIEHQRLVYGETLCSGLVQYINANGATNDNLNYQIVVAGHEIDDMTDMWLDDEEISETYINWPGDKYSGDSAEVTSVFVDVSAPYQLFFEKYLGTNSQWPSVSMVSGFTEINSYHRGLGMAYFRALLLYHTEVFSSGSPMNIRALVRGKRVYDPRSDSTQSFGTGPHRVDSAGTWEWSDNPALCWADYMTDTNLGFGEVSSRIDYGYVASAAEICDGVVYTPVGTDKRFRCNGVLSAGDTYRENIRRILSSMNGSAPLVNGIWKVRAHAYTTPTLEFSEDDLRDDLQIRLDPDEDQRFNTVRATFIDKDRLWKASEAPNFTSSEYIARDNNNVLYRDISLHMTKETYAAQRLMAGVLEQSDLPITVIAPTNYMTLPVELGGTIMLTNSKMNWVQKDFQVMDYKFRDLGGIDLVLKEDDPGAYADVATNEYTVTSGGGYVIPTNVIAPPSSAWVISAINGVYVNWSPVANRISEEVEIWWTTQNSFAQATLLSTVRDTSFLHRLERPQIAYYWLRSKNYLGQTSVFLPNSDQTDLYIAPSAYDTQSDTTFDKSDDTEVYWDALTDLGAGANWIVPGSLYISGYGINSSHAMTATNVNSDGGLPDYDWSSIVERVRRPIEATKAEITMIYRVESLWLGSSARPEPSMGIYAGLTGYSQAPISDVAGGGGGGMGIGVILPSSTDPVYSELKTLRCNSLQIDNTWHQHKFTLSTSYMISLGAKSVAINFGLNQVDVYGGSFPVYRIHWHTVAMKWVSDTLGPYRIYDADDPISSNHVDIDLDRGHSRYILVGSTISSITVSGWPSDQYAEVLLTLQRSGSSTAVVNTTAWPSGVKWNNGERLVLTTNSGGYAQVSLSTRDGGTTILANKVDEYS